MRHYGLMIAMVLLFAACGHYEESPELTEPAIVADVVYTPAQHGTGVGPSFGSSSSGSSTFGVSVVSVSIDPVYAVVFECQHGKFIIKRKELWDRLHEGDEVTIRYKEIYWVTKKGRALHDYDFLDAEPRR